MRRLATLFILLLGTGCSTFEYTLIQPAELERHIGRRADEVFQIDPLEYRMRSVDNRLSVRVFNPTSDPVMLLGAQSSVVDPNGQSHPLPSQTIAQGSFILLILPPMRPWVSSRSAGPQWNMGVGVGVRVDAGPEGGHDDPPLRPPAASIPIYLDVYDDGVVYDEGVDYWEWRGETDVRATLVFRRGESEFRHEFLFRRKQV